jgi:hypothetical protein
MGHLALGRWCLLVGHGCGLNWKELWAGKRKEKCFLFSEKY